LIAILKIDTNPLTQHRGNKNHSKEMGSYKREIVKFNDVQNIRDVDQYEESVAQISADETDVISIDAWKV